MNFVITLYHVNRLVRRLLILEKLQNTYLLDLFYHSDKCMWQIFFYIKGKISLYTQI